MMIETTQRATALHGAMPNPLHVLMLSLGAQKNGFSQTDISGYTIKQVRRACDDLVLAGKLFKAQASHKVRRYFDSKARADAFVARQQLRRSSPAPRVTQQLKASWSPTDYLNTTPETIYTKAPEPPARVWRTNTYATH